MIVHLEMVNILLAVRLFKECWKGRTVQIKCENEAVVTVLESAKTHDPYLAACARNIWLVAALHYIDLQYMHIRGQVNCVPDLLSRWQSTPSNYEMLHSYIQNPVWCHISPDLIEIDEQL